MRIAIVGSGIAGLTACHLLAIEGHEVHLFESQDQLGMSAQTVEFDHPLKDRPVLLGDVPSRMFNAALWPNVVKLYHSLGIETAPVDATQSYRHGDRGGALLFELPFRWKREAVNAMTATVSSLAGSIGIGNDYADGSLKNRRSEFLAEMTRLRDQGQRDLGSIERTISFAEYLDRHEFSDGFRNTFLFPALSSTVCTCSHASIAKYPAVILLDAMQHISGDQRLSRVSQGARWVANALVSGAEKVNLATHVNAVEDGDGSVLLMVDSGQQSFDHVVIATQANHVNKIYPSLNDLERETLSGVRYEDVDVVVHTDDRLMPRSQDEWATFNFLGSDLRDESMCTVWMNRFHSNWSEAGLKLPVFQTIRPISDVRREHVVRHTKLQRPIVDDRSWNLWKRLDEFRQQPDRRVWFCGSYAMPGVPLLESGVSAANEIVDAIVGGSSRKWTVTATP